MNYSLLFVNSEFVSIERYFYDFIDGFTALKRREVYFTLT